MGVSSTRIGPSNRLTGKSGGWTPALLSPTVWFDAASLTSGSTTWPNLGTAGSALDGTFGASAAAPRVLPHTGTNYLYLPGVTGNYASTPDSAALDITGDIELVLRLSLDDWTPSPSNTYSFSKRATGTNQRSWLVEHVTTGAVRLYWSSDGVTELSALSTANLSALANGQAVWLKITLDVDNGSGGNDVRFWWATDQSTEPTSWTQLGATVTTAGVTSIFSSTSRLQISGWEDGGSAFAGKVFRAIVRNGIGGTTVFDADFTTGITSGGQTGIFDSSPNNAAVTINRSTSGYKATAVVRPTLLFGGGQNIDVADNALLNFDATTSMTVVALVRQWATPTSLRGIVDKAITSSTGWSMSNSGTVNGIYGGISDGVNSASRSNLSTYPYGALHLSTLRVDRTAQTVDTATNDTLSATTSTSAVGTITNTLPMRIGALAGGSGGFHEGEINAVLLFRRALTAAEITQIVNYYGYEDTLAYTVGTLTTSAGYNILTFTGSGTFTPGRNLPVEYMVIGGGGGGGTQSGAGGGGGGAGGYLTNTGATKLVLPKNQQTVTIGAGGPGATTNTSGTVGSASSIGSLIVADGGGRGGGFTIAGGAGGSGGGGGATANGIPPTAGGTPTSGQGFAGGTGFPGSGSFRNGGGGGGATSAGGNATNTLGGNGGAAATNSISGTATSYAGGGGGGGNQTPGTGGGGGATAGTNGSAAAAATPNTGSGGGGGGSPDATIWAGGAGGSGIIIIRWPA